jgi:hypothetical protein
MPFVKRRAPSPTTPMLQCPPRKVSSAAATVLVASTDVWNVSDFQRSQWRTQDPPPSCMPDAALVSLANRTARTHRIRRNPPFSCSIWAETSDLARELALPTAAHAKQSLPTRFLDFYNMQCNLATVDSRPLYTQLILHSDFYIYSCRLFPCYVHMWCTAKEISGYDKVLSHDDRRRQIFIYLHLAGKLQVCLKLCMTNQATSVLLKGTTLNKHTIRKVKGMTLKIVLI